MHHADSRRAAHNVGFSALQRAEIAEISRPARTGRFTARRFSALQRAEIAEIPLTYGAMLIWRCFSALQRAEIAEIATRTRNWGNLRRFQCSSTSRNC